MSIRLDRKQLTFCELAWLPVSVGDFLLHQQAAYASCLLSGMRSLDLVYLLNSAEHLDPTFRPYVTESNQRHCLLGLMRIVDFNPLADQIRIIASADEAEEFLASEAGRYGAMWPSAERVRRYFYYDGLDAIIRCHQEHGPHAFLKAPEFLRRWGQGFFARHLPGRIPISVNIRSNPRFAVERNSDLDVWLEFLDWAQAAHPVGFVIVCATEEADPRFRLIPNVVLAKDHNTDLPCDLALIDCARAHMGVASGPSFKAILGAKPYYLARTTSDLKALGDRVEPRPGGFAFRFSSPEQTISHDHESMKLLQGHFLRILEGVDPRRDAAAYADQDRRRESCSLGADWLR